MDQAKAHQEVAEDSEANPESRFRRLPERVEPEEMVQSQPQPPRPDPAYDDNVEAIRWYGLPL